MHLNPRTRNSRSRIVCKSALISLVRQQSGAKVGQPSHSQRNSRETFPAGPGDEERFSSRTALGEAAVLTSAGRPFHRSEKARKKSARSVRSRKTTGRRGGGEEDTVESRKLKVEGQPKPRKIRRPDKVGAGRRDRRRSDPQKKGDAAESKMAT